LAKGEFFIANTGLDWLDPKTGKKVRVEAGERADLVPEKSRGWLLEQGLISPCDKDGKVAEPEPES
jgi:hypothetical protein